MHLTITPNSLCSSLQMVDDKDKLDAFSRSIAVPKEAFLQSLDMNVSVPFAAMFRFLNMTKVRKSNISVSPSMTLQRHHTCITTCCNFVILFFFFFFLQDENSSTILGNEVIAVEMGTTIRNLTDKISVSFRNMKFVSKTTNASTLVSLPTKRMFLMQFCCFVYRKEMRLVNHGMVKVFFPHLQIASGLITVITQTFPQLNSG